MLEFRSVIILEGKTATGFEVPEEIVKGLGTGKKPAVNVTVGGHTYRSTVAVMGGKFMIPLSSENREAAGVSAGDEVTVRIELDTEPRVVAVPEDFADRLNQNDAAKAFFEGLSYSNKRRIVLQIEGAKSAETRQRRIEKAVESLSVSKII
ncbi:YdeI/OmpD-associated family protein [Paenibacillus sp. GCM10027627]|uniref:YdeI/OmpD-associated family protein n=1 Tax=unclassified Paenibacillus TaxID=185978 RepID=UPI00362E839D